MKNQITIADLARSGKTLYAWIEQDESDARCRWCACVSDQVWGQQPYDQYFRVGHFDDNQDAKDAMDALVNLLEVGDCKVTTGEDFESCPDCKLVCGGLPIVCDKHA